MKKLVIADRQWSAHAESIAARLGGRWRVVASLEPVELADADAVLALEIPPQNLAAASGLRLFLFPGAGLMRADAADYPAGCTVVNVYEHGAAVAEYVMTAMLLWATALPSYAEGFRRGSWNGSGRTGGAPHGEIRGKTIGLIGYGEIGRTVAARAAAFEMRVLVVRRQQGDLPRLLQESDFVTVACPHTQETAGMLGAAELAMMKTSAYLINVARAGIVDERALFAALRDRRIAGAAIDVWYRYPANGEEMHGSDLPFHELPNVLATPHLAGWTDATLERRIARMVECLERYERGDEQSRVALVGTWRQP